MDIAKAIKYIRDARGVSQKAVAEASGISVPFLCLIEKGERQPSLRALRKIAKALDIPSEALVLLSFPEERLTSDNDRVRRLADSLRKLCQAEEKLSEELETDTSNDEGK